ncbi:MAG: CpsD/CapB family tyrosine-protein kinase [Candidatus Eisenbacteria bacterium]|uniref:non-specific protein-tyrosine kinase n=1 Tax=Eiseniibacteriota bacterium TaxID=2212470 RepID=A0A7Y2H2T5_UNCEI|nr:CpsD/CapB family tyrosine-protein kinase [Candidatus Eisenbacteria bacterium]
MKVLEAVHKDWPVATEVRKLQSRLWRMSRRDDLKVIMTTSAVGGEGKTTTVAYLAATMALHPGRRILAIDLDLRRPNLHTHFEDTDGPGFANYLRGECMLGDMIQVTKLEGLDLIVAGRTEDNPSLLLDSPQVTQVINQLKPRYDLILLDTPPLVPVADASSLVPLSDGVLMVVMAGKTPRPLLARARELCIGMGGNILGLVVGNAEEAAPDSYNYNYYYSYAGDRNSG